jgi:hypothetical protein
LGAGAESNHQRRAFSGGSGPLELAYALTVHKAQGSEFGLCNYSESELISFARTSLYGADQIEAEAGLIGGG